MVRTIYGWVFSAFTIVIGALFIWQVLDIYLGGKAAGANTPFVYEDVVSRIKSVIAIPFWIWIALIVVGFVLWEVFYVKEKLTPVTDARYVLYRLNKRIPAADGDNKISVQYVKEQNKMLKIMHYSLIGGVAAIFVAYTVAYVANPLNFTEVKNVTHEMLVMAKFILPVAAIIFVAGCIYVNFLERSAKRLLPHVKKLTAGVKAAQPVQPNKFTKIVTHKYFKLGVRIAIACVGVAFVIAGCFNGSVKELLSKAITICTECIGLG